MGVALDEDTDIMTTEAFATTTAYSDTLDLKHAKKFSIVSNVTVASGTADTFVDGDVDVTDNEITLTAHGWETGRKVAATTSGVLPAGLSATDYYVIKVDANTIKLASSYANSQAGTAVDITAAAGGGTHTLTPAALASATIALQASIDGSTWVEVASSSNAVTVTANFLYNVNEPAYRYARLAFALATGQLGATAKAVVWREERIPLQRG